MEFKPKIYMDRGVKDRLDHLTSSDEIQTEVAALLTGHTVDGGVVITGFLIPEQTATTGSVEITQRGFSSLESEFPEQSRNVIGHWHKHPPGCRGPSVTDENETFNILSAEECRPIMVYLISCQNSHMDKSNIYYYTRMNIFCKGITVSSNPDIVVESLCDEDIQELMQEVKSKVKKHERLSEVYGRCSLMGSSNNNKSMVDNDYDYYRDLLGLDTDPYKDRFTDINQYPYISDYLADQGYYEVIFSDTMGTEADLLLQELKDKYKEPSAYTYKSVHKKDNEIIIGFTAVEEGVKTEGLELIVETLQSMFSTDDDSKENETVMTDDKNSKTIEVISSKTNVEKMESAVKTLRDTYNITLKYVVNGNSCGFQIKDAKNFKLIKKTVKKVLKGVDLL